MSDFVNLAQCFGEAILAGFLLCVYVSHDPTRSTLWGRVATSYRPVRLWNLDTEPLGLRLLNRNKPSALAINSCKSVPPKRKHAAGFQGDGWRLGCRVEGANGRHGKKYTRCCILTCATFKNQDFFAT